MAAELCNAVVSGMASKVAEILFDPIRREITYVFKYQGYVEKLRTHVVDLKNRRQRLEHEVKDAENQGDEIYDDVQQHLIKMNEFIERADKLIGEDEVKAKNERCFRGFFPNLMSRHNLSKEAVNAEKVVADLLGKGNFSNVSYRTAPDRTEFINVLGDNQQFDSRTKILQDVMEALKDDNVNMIGVYGMGGVGKTTLVKEVARQVMEDKLIFYEVVMAEVTQTPEYNTIQDKIADDLDFRFDKNERKFKRADRLRLRLKKGKRVLVILDNIWAKLDLDAIGIPFGCNEKERKDEPRRCTVLLTSRSRHVLLNDMKCQKNFSVEVLSNAEAMSLFWNIVGEHATETSNFQPLAVNIVGKCAGLPIAIKTIANALKNKSARIWKDALNQLSNSNGRQIRGMDENVYSSIELSYDFLESEEARSLFRLCGLVNHGSRINIDNLMRYGIGLGLFAKVWTLEAGRNRVHALINVLKDSCLLLDGDTEDDVKMHDIIHAVVVSIAADDLMFNIHNVDGLKEELENVVHKDPTAISLSYKDISQLPERLECPKLKLFMLFMKTLSLEIPDHLFDGMAELRVLDLTDIHLHSLPSSLDFLINLRTLCLDYCCLVGDVDVGIVGEIKNLEILSFHGSNIKQLPEEIGQLAWLKLLDLDNCSSLEVIAPNVISKLSRLEELYMGNSFTQWKKPGEGSNASLVELKGLLKLTTLQIHIADAQIMPQDLVSVELDRHKIFVGEEWGPMDWYCRHETSRILKLSRLDKSIYLGNEIKMLLKRTEELVIQGCESMEAVIHTTGLGRDEERMIEFMVFSKLDYLMLSDLPKLARFASGISSVEFPSLRELVIFDCLNLKRFISTNSSEENNILHADRQSLFDEKVGLPSLEIFKICRVDNISKICNHQLGSDSFSKLKYLNVAECGKLVNIFPLNIIVMGKRLERLENLVVKDCDSIEEIIEETMDDQQEVPMASRFVVFPQLTVLDLCNLPKLKSVYQGIHILEWPVLEELQVDECNKLEILFASSELLNGRTESQQPVFLVDHHKVAFSNLRMLEISKCDRLRNLTTLSAAESLTGLIRMKITDCKMIENIIEVQEGEDVNMEDPIVFSQLEYLELDSLPRLTSFYWGNNTIEFPSLEKVAVRECPSMNYFSQGVLGTPKLHKVQLTKEERWEGNLNSTIQKLFEEMVGSGGLKYLKLSQFLHLKEIWYGQVLPVSFFSNLSCLVVDDSTFMSSAIPADLLRFLNNLEILEVRNCDSLEEVFHLEELNADQHFGPLFPELRELKLIDFPKLKRFCNFTGNIIELLSLSRLWVENCPNMETFISNSTPGGMTTDKELEERTSENFLADIQPLFDEKVAFSNLEDLALSKLPKLVHLWNKNSHSSSVFQNLKTLEISECSKLEQLVPFSVSFQNLRTLEISKCDGLRNLVTLSTAESLMKLQRMKITDCKMIQEIIQLGKDLKKDSIIFSELEYLGLNRLPSLTCFCLGNNTLEFQSLERVIVKECSKMEIFSQGVLSTPKLQRLQLNELEDKGRWEGSLNSTIQKLFEEMNVHSSKDED